MYSEPTVNGEAHGKASLSATRPHSLVTRYTAEYPLTIPLSARLPGRVPTGAAIAAAAAAWCHRTGSYRVFTNPRRDHNSKSK